MSDRTVLSCQQVVELVTDYLDDALPQRKRVAFERHVAVCPPCRGYLGQLRRISQSAGALREDDVPEALRASLLSAFRDWDGGGRDR